MTDSQKWLLLAALAGSGGLLYLLAPILMPFAMAGLLAYLGDPLADRLETRGLGRTAAVASVFAAMTLVLVLLLVLVVPLLEEQIAALIDNLPAYANWVEKNLLPWLRQHLGLQRKLLDMNNLTKMLTEHWQQAGGVAASLLQSVSASGLAVLHWLMNLILVPVVTFYLLRDWDTLVHHAHDLLPRRVTDTAARLAGEADEVLGAFLRGQFFVMLAMAGIYSVGLWIVGLNVALLVGVIAGLISFIPYMGPIVGISAAGIAALVQFEDLNYLAYVGIVFGVGQMLEGMVLTPRLVGNKIGLHPVAVIFSVLAGGQLFGFLGILLALPVASVVMVLIRHLHDLYKESALYSETENDDASEPDILAELPGDGAE
ncbi:MAG TPA: AI-2E family transporter [Methylococcaceae bacterium]|nr:AI-2E family transporter [Methylococcaceae bacterium]